MPACLSPFSLIPQSAPLPLLPTLHLTVLPGPRLPGPQLVPLLSPCNLTQAGLSLLHSSHPCQVLLPHAISQGPYLIHTGHVTLWLLAHQSLSTWYKGTTYSSHYQLKSLARHGGTAGFPGHVCSQAPLSLPGSVFPAWETGVWKNTTLCCERNLRDYLDHRCHQVSTMISQDLLINLKLYPSSAGRGAAIN